MEKMEKFEMEEEWRGDLEMGKEKVAGNSDREWKFWWLRAVYVMFWTIFLGIFLFLRYIHSASLPVFSHGDNLASSGIPPFVLEYAPLVYLDKEELYLPADILSQIPNTNPEVNFTQLINAPSPLTGHNLDGLNSFGNEGSKVYLTSTIDITENPSYLHGIKPDSSGRTNNATSCAVIVNDHGCGKVDAFYMYFYAYNQGNNVLGQELGNHVGDWEHNMVRFVDGKPFAIWFSQHANGEAFLYDIVEKIGKRPVTYSAKGSHANYATAGTHGHELPDLNLPFGIVRDYTSKGQLWDPVMNSYFYNFDSSTSQFSPAGPNENPVGIIKYKGQWGDEQYPADDPRQKAFFGFRKYVSGPTGPQDKDLNRTKVCPDNGILCILRTRLGP